MWVRHIYIHLYTVRTYKWLNNSRKIISCQRHRGIKIQLCYINMSLVWSGYLFVWCDLIYYRTYYQLWNDREKTEQRNVKNRPSLRWFIGYDCDHVIYIRLTVKIQCGKRNYFYCQRRWCFWTFFIFIQNDNEPKIFW